MTSKSGYRVNARHLSAVGCSHTSIFQPADVIVCPADLEGYKGYRQVMIRCLNFDYGYKALLMLNNREM